MTLLKERLQSAGVDTSQARLAALAVVALQNSRGSLAAAAEALWTALSREPAVAKEALLKPYLAERQRDMRGGIPPNPVTELPGVPANPIPHVPRRMPSPDRQRAITQIARKAVEAIHFKHLTSDGRDWATVGAHELAGMDRDGKLARAIRSHLGALSNSQQVKPLGDLMTAAKFNEVRASAEAQP